MQLISPKIEHKDAALDFRREHFGYGETDIHGDGGLDYAKTYEEWLETVQSAANREYSENSVPATVYFGVENGKIVGVIQIRHMLNERLYNSNGNIGYGIRPSERRKGYASQMLRLALEKCREMGMEKMMITCDKGNTASAKTIMKNGGVFFREMTENNVNVIDQYWVDIIGAY